MHNLETEDFKLRTMKLEEKLRSILGLKKGEYGLWCEAMDELVEHSKELAEALAPLARDLDPCLGIGEVHPKQEGFYRYDTDGNNAMFDRLRYEKEGSE